MVCSNHSNKKNEEADGQGKIETLPQSSPTAFFVNVGDFATIAGLLEQMRYRGRFLTPPVVAHTASRLQTVYDLTPAREPGGGDSRLRILKCYESLRKSVDC